MRACRALLHAGLRAPRRIIGSRRLLSLVACTVAIGSACARGGAPPSRRIEQASVLAYPPIARQTNSAGTVELQLAVSAAGTVTHVAILAGPALLTASAVDSVERWRFAAAPADSVETVRFKYELSTEDLSPKYPYGWHVIFGPDHTVTVQMPRLNAEPGVY